MGILKFSTTMSNIAS